MQPAAVGFGQVFERESDIRWSQQTGIMVTTGGLLVLTLVLRITVIVVDGDRLQSDPDAYVRLATMLAEGKGYVAANGIHPTAFRPVFYPLLLAGLLTPGFSSADAVAICNLMAGLVFVVGAVQLARELNLHCTGVAIVGFAAAADPLLVRYTTEPMTENVCAATFTVSLVYLLRFVRHARCSDTGYGFRVAAIAGLLLGVSVLCRPVVMVSCVLLSLTMAVIQWHSICARRLSVIPRLVWIGMPAVVAALTVAPWVIRNALHFGALIPATTHGGYTLLLGNNSEFYQRVVSGRQATWDANSLQGWQHGLHRGLEESGRGQADEHVVDDWMYQQAVTEIRNQPAMAVRAVILRWRRFWALTPTASGDSLPGYLLYAVGTWYGLTGIGLIFSLLRLYRNHYVILLWVSVMSFLVVHSFYWTNTRMRAPLTGALIVLSTAGWVAQMRRPPVTQTNGAAVDKDLLT
ncbi:MAG: hypothetical protein MK102_03810 [Fuerstiella sp.]|nr:hypothetical protein [Fuerstiella sp.]